MSEVLLSTKLNIPPLRPALVSRDRLLRRLNRGLDEGQRLTLVSAPAGFGKTTLVTSWIGALSHNRTAGNGRAPTIAWLSLDEGDSDPARFLTYLVATLAGNVGSTAPIGRGAKSMLQAPQAVPLTTVLTHLINDLAELSGPLLLVLDDYHLVDAPAVDDAVSFLLEHLPEPVRVILVTRADPNLPLSRLRARGQLTELRAADLRFNRAEAADFLRQVMGLNLSDADVAALDKRTEGWIAGLQLAAISMRGSKDVSAFVRSFTGSHRYVLDYLLEEVLEQQPEDVQEFLLHTALLPRLTGSLCDALTGRSDGRLTLASLERANLFLVPLDAERHWYRYHHLLADLLGRRLRQTEPEKARILHLRASAWYADHGFVDQAIDHALAGEDIERALHLLESEAEALWGRDEHIKLRRWLDRLPHESLRARVHLRVIYAWSLFVTGDQAAAFRHLDAVEDVLGISAADVAAIWAGAEGQSPDAGTLKLLGRVAVTRAFLAFFQNDVPAIITNARLALGLLPAGDLTWRSSAAVALGDAYSLAGHSKAAYQARLDSMAACREAGNVYMLLIAGLKLAAAQRERGHLHQTIETCRQQIRIADENNMSQTTTAGCLYAIWGEALAELNDLDRALALTQKGLMLTDGAGDVATLSWSYLCRTRALFSAGDLAGLEALVGKARATDHDLDLPPWFTHQLVAWEARVFLVRNDVESAAECLANSGVAAGEDISFQHEIGGLVLARVLIAQGRHDDAGALLGQLLDATEAGGRTSRAITTLLLQARLFHFRGDVDRSLESLGRALNHSASTGHTRAFLDEGPLMARLLRDAVRRGVGRDEASRVLAVFPAESAADDAPVPVVIDQSNLIETLSDRELEVLQYLAAGLTNREIADRFYLSPNTVKVHTRNIYGKLDVHSRTQAVARARELGLLSSSQR